MVIMSYFLFPIANFLSIFLNLFIEVLMLIAEISARIPFSSITVTTPKIYIIALYYISILLFRYRDKIKASTKRAAISFLVLILVFNIIYTYIPKDLKIYMVDVGQGDASVIVSPSNKVVVVDAGDGKGDAVQKYLLDRGIKTIDYIIVSHFDSDHCNGFIPIIERLNVKNIVISRQATNTNEFENVMNEVSKKKIKVILVSAGDKLTIDKDLHIDILAPESKPKYTDLNNNSIVCKLTYNDFSCLFTGDIEKTEKYLVGDEVLNVSLKSTVIKISHHGSKNASSENFLNVVKPKIALIGVGQDNKFGHPSSEVIERLNNIRK